MPEYFEYLVKLKGGVFKTVTAPTPNDARKIAESHTGLKCHYVKHIGPPMYSDQWVYGDDAADGLTQGTLL
jgi:hypothetical protein